MMMKGAHVKRTRHAHQVTSSALSILLHAAYDSYVLETNAPITLDDWIVKQVEAYPPSAGVCAITSRRKLHALHKCIASTGSMVLCPGPHSLLSLDSCTYT